MAPTVHLTSLPALHTSRTLKHETVAGQQRHRSVGRILNLDIAAQSLQQHLIAAFCRFIRQLLGGTQENICFLLLSDESFLTITSSTHDNEDVVEDVGQEDNAPTDFLLDLRTDPATESAAISKAIPDIKLAAHACLNGTQALQIRLDADSSIVPASALGHLADLLCQQIRAQKHHEDGLRLSVLNYPPYSRPIAFPQELEIEKYPALLHGCFERRVKQFPQRVAIDFLTLGRRRWQYTYHEIDCIATRVAATLGSGIDRCKSPVAVVMGPSPEMYISYLAALKCGRAFCPIPTDAPVERQLMILEDLNCSAVLTRDLDSSLPLFADRQTIELADLTVINASGFCKTDPTSALETSPAETRTSSTAEDDLAYIMYTSGTTGKPKGVQITHLSATCSIAAHSAVAPLNSIAQDPPTRWFQFAAPTFDPSIMEIFVTLSGGGTICSAERQLTLDNINAVLSQMEVDVMMATPSLASLVDPQQLKSIWTMGETLSTRVIDNFAGHNPDASDAWDRLAGPRGLYNAYGPTEAAINCTLLPHIPKDSRGSILGPALPSCSLIVVDENDHLRPVPWGCAGELLIAGPQVSSRGYLNRPEETARAFLHDTPWGRAYRTGDRARIVWHSKSDEPMVEFLGRISSDQVKLSGRRVELAEIDAVVMGVGAVREALTVVYKPHGSKTGGSEKPVTAISLVDGGADPEYVKTEIERAVEKGLPPFMRPFRILFEKHLPRSTAGKLDRRALARVVPKMIEAEATRCKLNNGPQPEDHASISPHLAELEGKLLDILSDIVGSRPGPTSDLVHDVGLDSLRAMQFLSRVRAQGLTEIISLQNLLSGTSIRQFLTQKTTQNHINDIDVQALLQQFSTRHFHTACELAGIHPQDVEKVLPSTATQSGMIASFVRSSHGSQRTYINHSCYHLNPGVLDVDRFVCKVEETLLAREAFRTTFVPVDDSLAPFAMCVISQQAAKSDRKWCRVSRQHGHDDRNHWLRQAEAEIRLNNNVLYRFQILNDNTLMISLFHGIFDGGSLELLLVDIERRYYALPSTPQSEISLTAELHFGSQSRHTDDFWLQETAGHQPESIPALSGNKLRRFQITSAAETCVVTRAIQLKYAHLQARSREINASPLAIWQTAWALLLSSFSETQTGDVMFGSVVSNRFDRASATCHGPTFSMLPCRVKISPKDDSEVSVGQLAAGVNQTNARMLAHAHPTLGLLATEDGKLPFDSLLALQHFEIDGEADNDREPLWNKITWPAMRNDFAIMLEVWPHDPHVPRCHWNSACPMNVKMTFRTDLLSEHAATRILAQLSSIADSILSRPELTASETLRSMPKSLISAENIVPRRLEDEKMLLHSQFELQAKTYPNKVALIFQHSLSDPASELTYGELNAQADIFARRVHRLFHNRTPVDTVIPICLEKSPELYVAVLGILKAGAAWCPIDTSFPAQRKLELVKRTGSSLLVTSRSSRRHTEGSVPTELTLLVVDEATPDTEPVECLGPMAVLQEHLAYLIWTSGTTGAPKGVMVPHTAAVHAMRALQESIPANIDMTTGEVCSPRVLNFCAYSFDVFVQDLFYTWGVGGTLISSTREIMLGSFVQLAVSARATHAHLTPSFAASVRRRDLGDALQVVTMIGEKLTEQVADDWSWHTRAFNTYGPAENAVVSTLRPFFGTDDNAKAANVGWSLSSVSSFVVSPDAPHRLVPLYGVGELALGGYQLARGYLNDPEKTQARFIWSQDLQRRIYLTGDIVRMTDHGVEFLGRNDDLVKLNGIRVELSEISATLAGVSEDIEHVDTLLLAHPDRPVKVVVSFVSLRDKSADALLIATDKRASELRGLINTTAHQLLPDYMLPSSLVLLNRMPRTASNKVDRKVLQSAYETLDLDGMSTTLNSTPSQAHLDPRSIRMRTPIEEKVMEMLSRLANVDATRIADHMSLARLGIHSILAIRLAWQLKNEAGIEIAVVDLLTCSTIGQLLDRVSSGGGPCTGEEERRESAQWLDDMEHRLFDQFANKLKYAPNASAPKIQAIRPTTAMQESLIVETLRNDRQYWSHRMFRLHDVDLSKLRAAWESIARDNEILRTSFVVHAEVNPDAMTSLEQSGVDSAILQVITASAAIRWTELNWDAGSESLITMAHQQACHARAEASPIASNRLVHPWSITILKHAATSEISLMWHIHHALHDAYSMDAILDDVFKHYDGRESAVHSRMQFGEAMRLGIHHDRKQMERSQDEIGELYGRLVEEFGPMSTTRCPDLTASRQSLPHQILRTSGKISPSQQVPLWEMLSRVHAGNNVASPAQIISQAFGCVLAEYLESKYVVLGEIVSQRLYNAGLESVMGPLIATVPKIVRIDISTYDLLSSKNHTLLGTSSHAQPAALRKVLGVPNDQPLYPALIVFHPRATDGQRGLNGNGDKSQFWHELDDLVGLRVEHPLALNIFEQPSGEGFLVELSGDNQVMSMRQLDLMLSQIMHQLEQMLARPHVPLDELNNHLPRDLLSMAPAQGTSKRALQSLACDVSWTGLTDPTSNPIAWVEYHARHHPDWMAAEEIVDLDKPEETRGWTYSQLLMEASRVLEAMLGRGVPKGSVVSLHLGRTLESFAAILALFRGEYIYLPLDEELPSERIRMLIVDAGAKAIITTRDLWDDLVSAEQNAWTEGLVVLLLEDVFNDPVLQVASSKLPLYDHTRPSMNNGYILYTSGSTGKPKGVRVTNSNLCSFIESFGKRILDNSPKTADLGGVGKYLNLASRAFDPHLTHMFMAWRLGLAATIGPRMMMLGNLESVIVQNSITHFGTVPSVLQQARLSPDRVPTVVCVTVGGEKVSNDVLDMWTTDKDTGDSGPLVLNVYGPTECTIGCTSNVVDGHSNARNIGKVLDCATAIVFAKESRSNLSEQVIAKRGQTGELCIAGDLVSLGYMSRPEAESKAFISAELPLGEHGTTQMIRLYKTGDLVRMMADGSLEYLGRSDQQAKVNGQRLELGEVEHFLRRTAEALQMKLEFAAAVIQHPDHPRPRLFAFVAMPLEGETERDTLLSIIAGDADVQARLSDACVNSLPAFMVPDLVWVTRIPYMKASGKVDVKQLTALVKALPLSLLHRGNVNSGVGSDGTSKTSPALDEYEQVVVHAIEHVLRKPVECPDANRSIYALGIDSLSAVQLSARLKQFGFLVSTANVLNDATIRNLAQHHNASRAEAASATSVQRATHNVELFEQTHRAEVFTRHGDLVQDVLPTMPLQSALLVRSLAQLEDDDEDASSGVPYVTHFRYSLSVSTDLNRFAHAVQKVLTEEDILRTCFYQMLSGEIAQVVLKSTPVSELFIKLEQCWDSWCVSNTPDTIARALVSNIEHLPPVRVHLFVGNPAVVLISIHHSLFDGEAIKQLRHRIQEHYNEQTTERGIVSLRQLVIHMEAENDDSAQNFWQSSLADAVPCLVDDSGARSGERRPMARANRRLSLPLSAFQGTIKSIDTSLNAFFQTAFALLMFELVPSRPEVTFGSVVSLRPLLSSSLGNMERLIVPCLNTLPQRISLSSTLGKDASLADLARKIRENFSATVKHAFTPLNHILRWCQVDQALFDAVISVNIHSHEQRDGSGEPGHALPGLMVSEDTSSIANVPFAADVNVYSQPLGDGYIEVELSSSAQKFDAAKVSRLAKRFEELCSLLVESHLTQLSSLLPSLPPGFVSSAHAAVTTDSTHDTDSWSADELLVRDVVGELLKIPMNNLSKHESFYRLGLDSVLVLRVVRSLRDRAGVKLSPVAVLRARSVAAVAKLLGRIRSSVSKKDTAQPLQSGGDYENTLRSLFGKVMRIEGSYLATPMQQGMLSAGLSHTAEQGSHTKPYVYQHTFELLDRSSYNSASFQQAWSRTVDQTEILRTTFHFTEDTTHPWLGIVRRPEEGFSAVQVLNRTEQVVNGALDIDVSVRLAHCTLVVPDALSQPIKVVFTMHHAIYDAASLQLLWRRFIDNYRTIRHGTIISMPSQVPFSRVARDIAVQQSGAVKYWAKQLQGYTFDPLPLADDTSIRRFRQRSHVIITSAEYRELKCKCQELGVTIQAALLLAWSKSLAARVLYQTDVVFGQVLNGQLSSASSESEKGTQSTSGVVIGPTLNTVAMRITLTPDLSNRRALEQIQMLAEEAQQHQVASLRSVQNEWRSSTPSATSTTLFESLFLFNAVTDDLNLDKSSQAQFWKSSRLVEEAEEEGYSEYPLVCNLSVARDGLHVRVSAAANHPDGSIAHQLSTYFVATLSQQILELDAPSACLSSTLQRPSSSRVHLEDGSKSAQIDVDSDEDSQALRETVLKAVQDLLQGEHGQSNDHAINHDTNLFSVGLDSILAIKLSSKLRRSRAPLTVNEIMQGKTVAAMLSRRRQALNVKIQRHDVKTATSDRSNAPLDRIEKVAAIHMLGWPSAEVESVLPCLAGQQHHLEYWMFAGHRFFEAPWIYRLTRSCAVSDVRTAWDQLRKSHPILRTTFLTLPANQSGGRKEALQVTRSSHCVNAISDGSFMAIRDDQSATLDAMVAQYLHQTNNKPSDLKIPPAQLGFLETAQGEAAIVMRLHHAMYDAWSIRLLLRDLDGLLANRQSVPAPSSLCEPVLDMVQQRSRHGEGIFWAEMLRSSQNTILPCLSAEASSNDGPLGPQHLVRLRSVVPAATVRSLETLSQHRASSSLSPAILLAFAQTISDSLDSGCSSPTFGFYHASRSLDALDLTQAMIPTMTLTPLTVDMGDATGVDTAACSMIETLQSIQNYLSQLTRFGQAPMHDILQSIGKPDQPLFNSYINLLYRSSSASSSDEASNMEILERFTPSVNTYFTESKPVAKAAPLLQGLDTEHIAPLRIFLDVVIDRHADGISLGIRCDRGLYDVEHIHHFAQRFVDRLLRVERVLAGKDATPEESHKHEVVAENTDTQCK